MDTRNSRWTLEATVDPNDKSRLRGFVRNEIAYFNALLAAFSSRLRTMPEVFTEIDHGLLGEIAAHGLGGWQFTQDTLPRHLSKFKTALFTEGKLTLSDNARLLLADVSNSIVLHPSVRREMALEVLKAHVRQSDALRRGSSRIDEVLAAPVELLHPIESRTKRHIQLPRSAVHLSENGATIATAYNAVPIALNPPLPKEFQWNLLVLRDEDRPGEPRAWVAEFRNEKTAYLVKLSDPPLVKKVRRPQRPVPAR
jgi:hypothetical protein